MATTYKVEIPLQTHTLQMRAIGYALGALEGIKLHADVSQSTRTQIQEAIGHIESLLQLADDVQLVSTPPVPTGPVPR